MKKISYTFIITINLILTMLIGCIEENNNNEKIIEEPITTLKELTENLNNYIGKNVTVNGFIRRANETVINPPYYTSFCKFVKCSTR